MQDSRIIDLYFARDEAAIAHSSKKYGAYCQTVAENILTYRQDAEECVSDTWLRAWQAMPPQRPQVLRLFFARITRNLALSRWRQQHAQKRGGGETALALEELGECVGYGHDPEQMAQAAELGEAIRGFLKTLTPRDRDVFLRRYFYIRSTEEIAAEYDISQENVLVILSRARKKLKRELRKGGFVL